MAWQKVDAQVANLAQPRVKVSGQAKGPLQEVMQMVSQSAINSLIDNVLDKAQANGQADYTLSLDLPIDNMSQAKVEGTVTFSGNDLQAIAGTPVLSKASDRV